MTYRSNQQKDDKLLVKQVIAELDAANQTLPDAVEQDISMARQRALMQARNAKRGVQPNNNHITSDKFKKTPLWAWGTPAAVAMVAMLLVSYEPNQAVVTIPTEMLSGELTSDDMHLISDMEFTQDLEFADWLAQQEQEALL